MPDVELRTALPAAECRARLQRAAAADLEEWQPDEPIAVAIDGDRFTAADVSDSGGPRLLRRWLHAEVLDEPGGGARIAGRFRLTGPARLALAIWFGSMSAVALLLALATLSGAGDVLTGVPAWLAVTAPLVMLAIAAALVRRGLAESARREQAVVDHLARLLA